MKIAACDFDGTLCRRGGVSREDLDAISLWRAAGNLFGLATGRDLNLSRVEIDKWGIEIDFLVCNTGASIYDGDLNLVHLTALPHGSTPGLIDHPMSRRSRYCLLSRAGQSYIINQSKESWLTGLGLPLTPIEAEAARALSGLAQFGLEFDSHKEARLAAEAYNRDLAPAVRAQQSGTCVDLIAAGIDKGEGLALMIELMDLKPEAVLAIGDSENDLAMFRRYEGYAVASAPEDIQAEAGAVVESPAEMLRLGGLRPAGK